MPIGSREEVTGLLLRDGFFYALRMPGGGTWRLDAGRKADRLVGQRVTVVGIRSGFDLLDVQSIRPAGSKAPPAPWWQRLLRRT